MKRRRLLSLTLALLLVVSLLPVSVLATDIQPGEPTEVFAQETIDNNYGDVGSNYGTIKNNVTVDGVTKSGFVGHNYGTVENNYGVVERNIETITNNNGTVGKKDESGNVVSGSGNYGTIEKNYGTVYNNQKDGTVETNNKTIEENYGTVGKKDENEVVVPGSGNSGTVEENYGTVITNNENGTVETNYRKVLINQKGGTIETNKGTVEENNGTVENNNGTVEENNGTVETNYNNVKTNNGKITDNNLDVDTNGTNGTIETNDHHVYINNGRIITNNDSVTYNSGTIETNNGTVNTNSGTVETNAIDGVVKNPISVETGIVTNFGTVGNNDIKGKTYFGLSWGNSVEKLTSIESFVEKDTPKNLDEIAQGVQRSGYKMTGYTAYYRDDRKDVKIDSTADYQMKAPTWLQILWEKIVNKSESHADDDTATPVRTVTYPTKVTAEDVKVGTVVQRKGMRFQVIEMDDGSILIATVGKLSQKDIEDMKAFLAKYFTAEQLEMLLGDPELLSDELVAKYFGGSLEHICFRAAKDIFAQ